MDAVLTAPERRTLVRLSLCPCFRRRWSSTCDALADGSLDVKTLRALFQAQVPLPAPGERPLWAVDGTHWPRPAAATSAARTWEYRPLPGKPQQGVVPAWAYHWLVQVPEPEGSWVLPLEVQPRGPTAETPTQVAIHQIAQARARQAAETPRPVVALDSAHEVGQLAQAHLEADLVVRLAKNRVFRRAPQPYSGRGRPHTHGPDHRAAPLPHRGRPLDLASGGGLLAALVGQTRRRRAPPALGAAAPSRAAHAGSRPAGLRWTFGHLGHAGSGAPTSRKIPRSSHRPTSRTRSTFPSRSSPPPQSGLRSQSVFQS